MTKGLKRLFSLVGACALVTSVTLLTTTGAEVALAFCFGFFATALFLLAGWYGIRIAGRSIEGSKPGIFRGLAATVFFAAKFPLILWAMSVSKTLGPSGPTWFLIGLALVYSALVGWGVVTSRSPG